MRKIINSGGVFKDLELRKRFMSGVFWSFSGSIAARALMLMTSFVVSREIGREAFGEFGIVQSTTIMLGELIGAGIGIAATKHLSEFRDKNPARTANILTLNIVLALASSALIACMLYSASGAIAQHILAQGGLAKLLRIGAFTVFFGALASAQLAALAGFEKFKTVAQINVLVALLNAALQIILVHLYGLEGVIMALCLSQAANCLMGAKSLGSIISKHQLVLTWSGARSEMHTLATANLPILISNILVVPISWLSNVILVNQNSGMSQMGIYNAANQWKMAFLYVPVVMAGVVLPMLTRIGSESGIADYKRLIWLNLALNAFIGLLAVAFSFTFGSFIMAGYGPGFAGTEHILQIIAVVAFFMAINNVIGQVIVSRGKHWTGVGFNCAWALALLLAAYLLIPRSGALGLVLANAIAYGLHTLWQMAYVMYLMNKIGEK